VTAYWTDKTAKADGSIVHYGDTDAYVATNGTTYPGQYDKALIPGLIPVTMAARPDETPAGYTVAGEARGGVTVTGWHVALVEGVPTQVWDTEARPEMTVDEAAAAAARELVAAAQAALDTSDVTIIRCAEAGISVPEPWRTYRDTLRAIVAGRGDGPLPARPDYPQGT